MAKDRNIIVLMRLPKEKPKRPSGGRKHCYPKEVNLKTLADGYRPKRPPVEETDTNPPQGYSISSYRPGMRAYAFNRRFS